MFTGRNLKVKHLKLTMVVLTAKYPISYIAGQLLTDAYSNTKSDT